MLKHSSTWFVDLQLACIWAKLFSFRSK